MSQQFVQVSILVAGRNIVDPATGKPTTDFMRVINDNTRNFRIAVNQLASQAADIEASLTQAGIALTTADAVQASLIAAEADRALVNSYVNPNAIIGSDIDPGDSTKRTIQIINHTRKYGDGTSVAVTGTTLTGLTAGTLYFVYYDDPARAGGAVTYVATQDPTVAVQGGNRHTVGSITTVASGSTTPTTGGGTTGPGVGYRDTGYAEF